MGRTITGSRTPIITRCDIPIRVDILPVLLGHGKPYGAEIYFGNSGGAVSVQRDYIVNGGTVHIVPPLAPPKVVHLPGPLVFANNSNNSPQSASGDRVETGQPVSDIQIAGGIDCRVADYTKAELNEPEWTPMDAAFWKEISIGASEGALLS